MIGVDVVECRRIEQAMEHPRFLERIFSKPERDWLQNCPSATESTAGLWAAKEAIAKALGTGIGTVRLREIEVFHTSDGKPEVQLHGEARRALQAKGAQDIDLSITHDGGIAIAVAELREGEERRGRTEKTGKVEESQGLYRDEELLSSILHRDRTGYKSQYGRTAIVGASQGMAGSVCLAAQAAMRTGAGLVYVVVPETIASLVQMKLLEPIVVSIPDEGTGHFTPSGIPALREALKNCDCVALGPGMGRAATILPVLREILPDLSVPCLLDADALNAISSDPHFFDSLTQPLILTPHEMEMSRLCGCEVSKVQAHRREIAAHYALSHHAWVVLKGADTVITDGTKIHINHSGNPGMATAGSGDVLTGIVAALLGYGYQVKTAVRLGCYMHGLAGDIARGIVGEESLIASDLIRALPRVFHFLQEAAR